MTEKTVPNLFDYATKELSQDAMICWLIECANDCYVDVNKELHNYGREFVKVLMQCGDGAVIDSSKNKVYHHGDYVVSDVKVPKRQHRRIDVYFQAKVDGKTISFVIEDKTHTEMHSNQLSRHLGEVISDDEKEDFIKPIYLKTGYVFDDEREKARSANYSVFDGEDMVGFIERGEPHTHEILQQYSAHLCEEMAQRKSKLEKWNLAYDFVQWKFMCHLEPVLQLHLRENKWPARGFNNDGSPWTQYPYYNDKKKGEENRAALFWRLDSNEPAHLRLMVDTAEVQNVRLGAHWDKDWEEHWESWYKAFEVARGESELEEHSFRRNQKRNGKPVKEGTIGAVKIEECLCNESVKAYAEKVGKLHQVFTRKVGKQLS